MTDRTDLFRRIPAVDRVLQEPALADLDADRSLVADAVRAAVDGLRREIAAGRTPDLAPATLAAAAAARLREALSPSLVPVINATGVIIHTNLGRAPLGAGPLAALAAVAAGYSNLEYDLAAGTRGSRFAHLAGAFARVAGAEAALVVNNNAAAVLLALTALARGREVVISRGELIEIGGSFRIPDVMAAGGARLREVGTTNRTHLRDYEAALGPETALLMIAHRSNFTVEGFTAGVERAALVALGRPRGVPVYEDLGSGCLVDLAPLGIRGVDTVSAALAAGVDLVSFSGDKLLGGPQAGILLGRPELIARLRRHPLARALRPDRLTLAGLEAVLRDYLSGDPWSRVPVLRMLSEPLAAVRARAERLALELAAQDLPVEVVETTARVGGGAAPDASLPSAGVRVQNAAAALEAGLRAGRPPVLGRLEDAALILDLRTVGEDQVGALRDAVRRAARAIAP